MTLSQSINWRGRLTEFTQKSDLKPPTVIEIRTRGWPGTFSFVCELAWGNKTLRTCGTAMKKKFAKREAARLMCCRVADLTDDLLENPACNPHNPNDEGYWGPFYPYVARSRVPSEFDETSAPELTPPRRPSINKRNNPPPRRVTKPIASRARKEASSEPCKELQKIMEGGRREDREVHRSIRREAILRDVLRERYREERPVAKKVSGVNYKSYSKEVEPSFEDLLRMYKPEIELEKQTEKNVSPDIHERRKKSLDYYKPEFSPSNCDEFRRSCKRRRSFSRSPTPRRSKHSPKTESSKHSPKTEKHSKKKKKKRQKKDKKRSKKKKKKNDLRQTKDSHTINNKIPSEIRDGSNGAIVLALDSETRPPLEPIPGVIVDALTNVSLPPLEPDSPEVSKKIMIIIDSDDDALEPEWGEKKSIICLEEESGTKTKSAAMSSHYKGVIVQDKNSAEMNLKLESVCTEPSESINKERKLDLFNQTVGHPAPVPNLVGNTQANGDVSDPTSGERKSATCVDKLATVRDVGHWDNDQKSESPAPEPRNVEKNIASVLKNVDQMNTTQTTSYTQAVTQDVCVLKSSSSSPDLQGTKNEKLNVDETRSKETVGKLEISGRSKSNVTVKLSAGILSTPPNSTNVNANLAIRICSNVLKDGDTKFPNIIEKKLGNKQDPMVSELSIFPTSSSARESPISENPLSLLNLEPKRSCFRKTDRSNGSHVRFKKETPKWLPVSKQNYCIKQVEMKHPCVSEAVVPKIIPRKKSPTSIPCITIPKITQKDTLSKPRLGRTLFGKIRSPPPKKKLNRASADVEKIICKNATADYSDPQFEAKHMELDEKEVRTSPVHHSPHLSTGRSFSSVHKTVPTATYRKSANPPDIRTGRTIPQKPVTIWPRRSLRLSCLQSKSGSGKIKEGGLFKKRTKESSQAMSESKCNEVAKSLCRDKHNISKVAGEICHSLDSSKSRSLKEQGMKHSQSSSVPSPALSRLRRTIKRKPGGKGSRSRKKKVTKRKAIKIVNKKSCKSKQW